MSVPLGRGEIRAFTRLGAQQIAASGVDAGFVFKYLEEDVRYGLYYVGFERAGLPAWSPGTAPWQFDSVAAMEQYIEREQLRPLARKLNR